MIKLVRRLIGLCAICFALTANAESSEALKHAAEQGDADAQYRLGMMYAEGFEHDDPWDGFDKAWTWLELAVEQEHEQALSALVPIYAEGRTGPLSGSYVRWRKLAEKPGNTVAQTYLGMIHADGQGLARDEREAVNMRELVMRNSSNKAKHTCLGSMYAEGREALLAGAYIERWHKLAEEPGNTVAKTCLGLVEVDARILIRDEKEALKWFELAAKAGNAVAQAYLGWMYAVGRGVERNEKEAVKWFELAMEQENEWALKNLGLLLHEGWGGVLDGTDMEKWRKLAEKPENAVAQTYLGMLYAKGRGVVRDEKEAVKWFELAAKSGNAVAQTYLGLMYAEGRGVERNDAEAVKWYELAGKGSIISSGYSVADTHLGMMRAKGRGVERDEEYASDIFRSAGVTVHPIEMSMISSQKSEIARSIYALMLGEGRAFDDNTISILLAEIFRASGKYRFVAAHAGRISVSPGIATDKAGNRYVANTFNHNIRKVTPEGMVTTLAGSDTTDSPDNTPQAGYADGNAARFHLPRGIAIDKAGNLYVADGKNRIRKITPAGKVTTLVNNTQSNADIPETKTEDLPLTRDNFDLLTSIVVDAKSNLFVTDSNNHRILKITPKGKVSTFAGSERGFADGVGGAAKFDSPHGITIDAGGNLYVADSWNHRIRKITPRGKVSTLIGSDHYGLTDGTGADARLYLPGAMTIDEEGNLYVVEKVNDTIRKITPALEVTTLLPASPEKR